MVTIHGKFQGDIMNNRSDRSNQIPSHVVVIFAVAPGEIRLQNSLPFIMLLLVF
jgi:hypothetical protein